jgi:hypothetical protein
VIDDNPEPPSPAAPQSTHPSPKAVELFQRALEIEAAGATGKWEPEGRRLEYLDIDIALMRGTWARLLECERAAGRRECRRPPSMGKEPPTHRVLA